MFSVFSNNLYYQYSSSSSLLVSFLVVLIRRNSDYKIYQQIFAWPYPEKVWFLFLNYRKVWCCFPLRPESFSLCICTSPNRIFPLIWWSTPFDPRILIWVYWSSGTYRSLSPYHLNRKNTYIRQYWTTLRYYYGESAQFKS